MEATTRDNVERALLKRLFKEKALKQAYYEMEMKLPTVFLRGPFQREICRVAGLPFIPREVAITNDLMKELGYKLVIITGLRYFRKIHE